MSEAKLNPNACHNPEGLYIEPTADLASNKPGDAVPPLFRHLGTLNTYPPETMLFAQGSPIHTISLVEDGWVMFTRTDTEGREAIIALRSHGKLLGAAAIISQKPAAVTAITLTKCRVYSLSATHFLKQIETNREFLLHLNQSISQQSYELMEQLARLSVAPARARLAHFLLQLVPEAMQVSTSELRLEPLYKWAIVAGWLAIRPEHLSRLLKDLENDGVIRRSKGWIYLSNLDRLAREAVG